MSYQKFFGNSIHEPKEPGSDPARKTRSGSCALSHSDERRATSLFLRSVLSGSFTETSPREATTCSTFLFRVSRQGASVMIISLYNLAVGVKWWHQNGWPRDMHNADYLDLYTHRSSVGSNAWWSKTVDRLWKWQAIRNRTPPNSKADILARGESRLGMIARSHAAIISKSLGEPSILNLDWQDVAPLFALAYGIKRGNHAVFASKMCHFMFPDLFVVMDHTVTGTFEYEFYWRGMKAEWSRFAKKPEACWTLTNSIQTNDGIFIGYPCKTKIMELCHIGYNQRNNQR